MEADTSLDIKFRNIPDIPQWEKLDFFMTLINFATSIGDVFTYSNDGISLNLSSLGTHSSGHDTVDFEAKNEFNKLLFSNGS